MSNTTDVQALIDMIKEYGRLCADDLPESAARELAVLAALLGDARVPMTALQKKAITDTLRRASQCLDPFKDRNNMVRDQIADSLALLNRFKIG